MIDALGDIVSRAKILGRLDFQAALSEECGVAFCDEHGRTRYHILIDGNCWAMIDGAPAPVNLNAVSLLIVPRGKRHTIAGSVDAPIDEPGDFGVHRPTAPGSGTGGALNNAPGSKPVAAVVSGVFEMDRDIGNVLVDELPAYLHMSLSDNEDLNWLADAVRFVARDVAEGAPGAAAVADRLGKIIFMETIKAFAETAASGVIASLRDPKVGAALSAFHRAPAESWTVSSLAKAAGVSRTLFAERANALLGMTPMQYVRDWRLMLARRMLAESARSIEEVAREVGYSSASAFTKAYRSYYGVDPRRKPT